MCAHTYIYLLKNIKNNVCMYASVRTYLVDGLGDGISGVGGLRDSQILLELFSARADDRANLTQQLQHIYIYIPHIYIHTYIP